MEITYPSNLLSSLKNKHLLLDTNVFTDAVSKPTAYTKFFNDLKSAEITVVTSDLVKYEFLIGSADVTKYREKEKHIDDVVDAILPISPKTYELAYELIKEYGIESKVLSTTDLLLGALLKQYKESVYLMTRDTSDFIQNIFDLVFIINCPLPKGIFTYGVYKYK